MIKSAIKAIGDKIQRRRAELRQGAALWARLAEVALEAGGWPARNISADESQDAQVARGLLLFLRVLAEGLSEQERHALRVDAALFEEEISPPPAPVRREILQ